MVSNKLPSAQIALPAQIPCQDHNILYVYIYIYECVCLSSNTCSKSMDRMAQLYTITRKFISAAPNIALNQSHERLQPRRWQVFTQHSASEAPKDVFFESMASQSLPNSASELIELQLPLGQLLARNKLTLGITTWDKPPTQEQIKGVK